MVVQQRADAARQSIQLPCVACEPEHLLLIVRVKSAYYCSPDILTANAAYAVCTKGLRTKR